MLQKRNLSVNDKKRLLVLATREIEQNGEIKVDPPTPDSGHRGLGIPYVSPSILHGFLKKYNQSGHDNILRNTCHLIDDEDDIDEIIKECNTESYDLEKHSHLIEEKFSLLFEEYKKEYPDITRSKMISLIRAYITGKNFKGEPTQWSSIHINTNWQSKDLLEWGKQNPHKIPSPGKNIAIKQRNNGYKLKERLISNLTGKPIRDLNDLVIYFKSLFHIRNDNSLKTILSNGLKKEKEGFYSYNTKEGNASIHFADTLFPENIELLTDVDKLLQTYYQIIGICIRNQNKEFGDTTIIELYLYEDNDRTTLCIHHTNSRYGKTAKNAIERIGKDQEKLIKKQINGLCDLYIEADFGGSQYYNINLWDEKPNMEYTNINEMKGVKYILRF